MKKILILGAGLVGGPIALDLEKENGLTVAVADISRQRLEAITNPNIHKIQADLSKDAEIRALVGDFDLVVNAVPGFMGFNTLRTCIEEERDVVDIAFYPEDVFELSELALQKGVRVIADMGVAPGMSNLLTGYAASQLDHITDVAIYVGGLPKVRVLPWEYKAVFSPADVIEEYTRTARLIAHGEIEYKEALTELEQLHFDKVGTLEAFNSDGLRSLLFTIKADRMREKTLRYPGYTEKIKLLSENGFFSPDKIEVDGQMVSPLAMTSKLLFDKWKLNKGDEDITVMRIAVEGFKDTKKIEHRFELYDEYDADSGVHSMARTTGYAASMAVRLLLNNLLTEKGVFLPEHLGKNPKLVHFMLDGLRQRNVVYKEERTEG